jgi:hypothetical protein
MKNVVQRTRGTLKKRHTPHRRESGGRTSRYRPGASGRRRPRASCASDRVSFVVSIHGGSIDGCNTQSV